MARVRVRVVIAAVSAIMIPPASGFLRSTCIAPPPALIMRSSTVSTSIVSMRSDRNDNEGPAGAGDVTAGRGAFLRTAMTAIGAGAAVLAGATTATRSAEAVKIGGLPVPFTGGENRPEQSKLQEIAQYSLAVNKLERDLREGGLKGGHDDSAVVIRVLETYLNPMQQKMLSVAPELKIAGREKLDRVKLLPLLMKGHLLELGQACDAENAKDQLREVEEVKETLDEFLTLAKSRYEVFEAAPTSPEGDQLGIFGCTFYGLNRVEGTNTCQDDQ